MINVPHAGPEDRKVKNIKGRVEPDRSGADEGLDRTLTSYILSPLFSDLIFISSNVNTIDRFFSFNSQTFYYCR